MPQFTTKRIVTHSPAQMFALVADVERYPEFLPLCESLVVRARDTDAAGNDRISCRLTVGYGLVRETFTTQVTLQRAEQRIAVRYLEGPFRKLDNIWNFRGHPVDGLAGGPMGCPSGCEVEFFIDYEFRSLPLQLLMGAMFDRAFRKFSAAFEARADEIYRDASV